ncbi:MAG: hypothetical protein LBH46_02825 [Rickettsiales bacterium]|jgi:hypothetical protein|nr:hypothetical protein [Rickettsiales bacterium]
MCRRSIVGQIKDRDLLEAFRIKIEEAMQGKGSVVLQELARRYVNSHQSKYNARYSGVDNYAALSEASDSIDALFATQESSFVRMKELKGDTGADYKICLSEYIDQKPGRISYVGNLPFLNKDNLLAIRDSSSKGMSLSSDDPNNPNNPAVFKTSAAPTLVPIAFTDDCIIYQPMVKDDDGGYVPHERIRVVKRGGDYFALDTVTNELTLVDSSTLGEIDCDSLDPADIRFLDNFKTSEERALINGYPNVFEEKQFKTLSYLYAGSNYKKSIAKYPRLDPVKRISLEFMTGGEGKVLFDVFKIEDQGLNVPTIFQSGVLFHLAQQIQFLNDNSDPNIQPTRVSRLVKPLSSPEFVSQITAGHLSTLSAEPSPLKATMRLYDQMKNPKANSPSIRSAKLSVLLTAVFSHHELTSDDNNMKKVDDFIKNNFDSAGKLRPCSTSDIVEKFLKLLGDEGLGVDGEVVKEFEKNLSKNDFLDISCFMRCGYGKIVLDKESAVGDVFHDFKERAVLKKESDRILRELDKHKFAMVGADQAKRHVFATRMECLSKSGANLETQIANRKQRAGDTIDGGNAASIEATKKLNQRLSKVHIVKSESELVPASQPTLESKLAPVSQPATGSKSMLLPQPAVAAEGGTLPKVNMVVSTTPETDENRARRLHETNAMQAGRREKAEQILTRHL